MSVKAKLHSIIESIIHVALKNGETVERTVQIPLHEVVENAPEDAMYLNVSIKTTFEDKDGEEYESGTGFSVKDKTCH